MSVLLTYLIQLFAISGILYGYYHFALRNKKFHQYNRFYLLISTVLSLTIPFLNIPVYFTAAEEQPFFIQQTLAVIASNDTEEAVITAATPATHSTWFSLQNILLLAYLLIGLLVLIRMIVSLIRIRQLIKTHTVEKLDNINFINTSAPNTPFSFFNWMFWNNTIELQSEKGKQIFRHEFFHIKQRHSWDVVFIELVTVIFWINPFFHLIKKETKTIHEFLADQFAMKDTQHWQYAELLLMQALNTNQHLINPFFHNQIKRRIAMITTSQKPSYRYLRKMMLLPLAAIAVALFAFSYKSKKTEIANSKEQFTVVVDAGHGGSDAGAIASDGTTEKDIVLAIAQKIKALNEDANIKIVLTREEDNFPGLQSRVDNTNKHKADLFISLHVNSTEKTPTDKSGVEVFISGKNKTFEAANKTLANIMLNSFSQLLPVNKNILKREVGIFVLDNAPCPAAIIECGYLNNPTDLKYIKDPAKQDEIANSILQSIKQFTLQNKETAIAVNASPVADTSIPKKVTVQEKNKKEIKINGLTYPTELKPLSGKLIVLDGLRIKGPEAEDLLKNLDPVKINTVSIIKGAAAIYKYGEEGMNGVIEITTKKAKVEGVQLSDSTKPSAQYLDEVVVVGYGNKTDTAIKPSSDNKIFTKVEIDPAFPGGNDNWKIFLMKNLDASILKNTKTPDGDYTVVVQFIVDKDGFISDVKALTNHGYGLEEEAVRVIKKGPKWLPAIQNGRQVTAIKKQPITFVVKKAAFITKPKSPSAISSVAIDNIVKNGVLSTPFGKYEIEGTKLVGNNPGITIKAAKGSQVVSAQDGTVLSIFNLGGNKGIIIGDNSTVSTTYSNLDNITVTKGQKIAKGDILGELSKDDNNNNYTLDFIVLRKTQAIDPLEWLKNQ